MAKIDDLGQLTLVGGIKIGNIDARLRPAQRPASATTLALKGPRTNQA
jgi:hypothetical protein